MNRIKAEIKFGDYGFFKESLNHSISVDLPAIPNIGERISLIIDGELHEGRVVDLVHEMELNSGSGEQAGFHYRCVKIVVDPSN